MNRELLLAIIVCLAVIGILIYLVEIGLLEVKK